jgi:hypothetical protein
VELADLAVSDGREERSPAGLVEVACLERFLDREGQQARIGWARRSTAGSVDRRLRVVTGRGAGGLRRDAGPGFQDPERPFEGIGGRGVLGGGGPQPRDQALDLAAPTARLGKLERLARDVASVGEAPVALEDGGQAVERLGGLGAPSEGGQHVGAAVHRALVCRRPVQR